MIWKDEPDQKDYPAAADYLSLCIADLPTVMGLVDTLRLAKLEHRRANDILRASGHDALPAKNREVRTCIRRVAHGRPLSPILLIVDDDLAHPLVIADGYHRVSASYRLDEDTDVPCRIARLRGSL